MHNIVITGGTRGIGFGLAEAFLSLGCTVTISGRSKETVNQAIGALAKKHGADRVLGVISDVTEYNQVQVLWNTAHARFGRIHIWINNAGLSHPQLDFRQLPAQTIAEVVRTNILGAMNGCRVALHGMLQQGQGFIYNMEGFGSNGRKLRGLALYGCSKYALAYLTDSLVMETRHTKVRMGAIRPGMVVTDLLTGDRTGDPKQWERSRHIFNILADTVETVTPWIAQKVLANERHGARIIWLTGRKAAWRFATARLRKRTVAGI